LKEDSNIPAFPSASWENRSAEPRKLLKYQEKYKNHRKKTPSVQNIKEAGRTFSYLFLVACQLEGYVTKGRALCTRKQNPYRFPKNICSLTEQ